MSASKWVSLDTANSLDEVRGLAALHGVCQCRITNLKNSTKYSFKCSEYRKYSLCSYKIESVIPGENQHSILITSKNSHNHDIRNETYINKVVKLLLIKVHIQFIFLYHTLVIEKRDW